MKNSYYIPKTGDIADFSIIGYRLPNGKIMIGSSLIGNNGCVLDNFPTEVKVCDAIYTLERIKKNDPNNKLPVNHKGKNIEWGEYV